MCSFCAPASGCERRAPHEPPPHAHLPIALTPRAHVPQPSLYKGVKTGRNMSDLQDKHFTLQPRQPWPLQRDRSRAALRCHRALMQRR